MNPYFEDEAVTLYFGDSREMRWPVACENTTVITDPPYGTSLYPTDKDALSPADLRRWANDGRVALFGWPERLASLLSSAELTADEWVTWWPTNARYRGFNPRGLWRESEHIAILGVGCWERLTQPAAITTSPMPNRNKRIAGPVNERVRMGDVWRDESPNINPNQRGRLHPNEKPESVMERLVVVLSDAGDVIYDPFAGSGTTLVAARRQGRLAIGVEINEAFCESAAIRLSSGELDLFAAYAQDGQ